MICEDRRPHSLRAWLREAGVANAEIGVAFNAWALQASKEIDEATAPTFVAAAELISEARWTELYNTDFSTIMYLDAAALAQLSEESELNRNASFQFRPPGGIPIAVTIRRDRGPAQVAIDAPGAEVTADAEGNCVHLSRLLAFVDADGSAVSVGGLVGAAAT
jgi:hypothetical protein